MPNTPVTVEQGCTVWCSTPDFPQEKKELISRLFSSIGNPTPLQPGPETLSRNPKPYPGTRNPIPKLETLDPQTLNVKT